MKFALIEAEKAHFPVAVLCEVLEVSRSGFYAWQSRPPSDPTRQDAQLAVEITAAHGKSGERYGSPRVHRALRKKGVRVGEKRVARLMREKGLAGRQKRRFRRTPTRSTPTRSRRTCSSATSNQPARTRPGPET